MTRFLTVLLAGTALAAPACAETTLSFYTGYQGAFDSHVRGNVDGEDFDFLSEWEGRPASMPPYWGVRATWWRSENLGFGVDYSHNKIYASDDTLEEHDFDTLEMTDGINILVATAFYRWPGQWAQGRLTPYVGGGLGVSFPHVEVTKGDSETFEYQITGPAAMLALGVSWKINDKWDVFGEYKSTFSDNNADLDGGGDLQTYVTTYAFNIGVSYNF